MPRSESAAKALVSGGLETVRCDVCGGEDARPLFEKHGYWVLRCLGCGVGYVSPRPAQQDLATIYETEQYYRNSNACAYGYADYISDHCLLEPLVAHRLDEIERLRPQRGRLLDIGCATGLLLKEAKARGWGVHGVDVSGFAASFCRGQHLPVHNGELSTSSFPAAHFDVIVMDDTVEHLPYPRKDLELIHRILKPGGLLTINTADEGGLLRTLMRRSWFHYKPTEHLYYFNRRNLAGLLTDVGFSVESVKLSGKIVTLRYLCGRLRAYNEAASRVALRTLGRAPGARRPFFLPIGEFVVFATRI